MIRKLISLEKRDSYNLAVDKYSVQITDLVLDARVGIHSYEKVSKQPINININVFITPLSVFNDDSIKNIVDYEKIVNGIKTLVNQEHTNLVEVLAQKIAKICLEYKTAESAIIKIEKLDIINETKSVGVEVKYKKTFS